MIDREVASEHLELALINSADPASHHVLDSHLSNDENVRKAIPELHAH